MGYLQNLHTHTTFCDGRDTPEEVLRAALEKGFDSIGFSEHSTSRSPSSPTAERLAEYRREIRSLARKYEGQIDVFCGLEFDTECPTPAVGYDYLIGSMHFVYRDGERFPVDGRNTEFERAAEHYGSALAFAKAYFEALCTLPDFGKFDIVGHFDLVSKNVERTTLLDPEDPTYIQAGLAAIDALAGRIPFFEVNTGAIARGYRTAPYPAPVFLRALREKGFGAVITSDCHDARFLDCHFDGALALLEACGFTERYILTKDGFKAVALRD